jgi:hypothetical protein
MALRARSLSQTIPQSHSSKARNATCLRSRDASARILRHVLHHEIDGARRAFACITRGLCFGNCIAISTIACGIDVHRKLDRIGCTDNRPVRSLDVTHYARAGRLGGIPRILQSRHLQVRSLSPLSPRPHRAREFPAVSRRLSGTS